MKFNIKFKLIVSRYRKQCEQISGLSGQMLLFFFRFASEFISDRVNSFRINSNYCSFNFNFIQPVLISVEMGNASSLKHHIETAERTGVIQLTKTNLREIPKDLTHISHLLRTLDLSFNRLQILNENISSFKNLKTLNLSHNKLKIISNSIGQLVKLETLNLENNLLESLPNEVVRLENLKTFNLSSNMFKRLPVQALSFKNIELLDLSKNEIELIPDEVGKCNAYEINLNNNKLTKLNDNLTNSEKLKILRLDNNQINLNAITRPILADSKICLLSLENNPFTLKQLQDKDGYEQYSERYTSTKRKLM